MAELLAEVPERALAIYAHPDDPDVSCGGTLAAWAAAGCEVHTLLCTDGGKGTADPAVDPAELVAATGPPRPRPPPPCSGSPARSSSGYPDGELDGRRGRSAEALVAAVRRLRPDVVLCPDPTAVFFGQDYFNHRDHRITGFAVLDAVAPAAAMPHYFPDAGPAHQVVDRPAVGDARAGRVGGHLVHGRPQGRGRRPATAASSPTAASGRPRPCGWPRRTPAARPGCRAPRGSGDCASGGDGGARPGARPAPGRSGGVRTG